MRNDEISKEEKSKQLTTLYNFVSDDYTKSLIISEMSKLLTKTNFRFLLDEYPNVSGDKIKGEFGGALHAHYGFYRKEMLDPDILMLKKQYKEIYSQQMTDTENLDQLKVAIEQIHDVNDIEEACEYLKQLDPKNQEYRKEYTDQMLITLIVTDRGDELITFIREMDGCEYDDFYGHLALARAYRVLSAEEYDRIIEQGRSKAHGQNCQHQNLRS
jgi:hypothetical protein